MSSYTPWPQTVINIFEHVKTLLSTDINPFYTKKFLNAHFPDILSNISDSSNIGNGAICIAILLDSQSSNPILSTNSTYEEVNCFLANHIEQNGADVYYNRRVEVKDANGPFRAGATNKTIQKCVRLLSPLNDKLQTFADGLQQLANEKNDKIISDFIPTIPINLSWGPKKYKYFTSETKPKTINFLSIKKYLDHYSTTRHFNKAELSNKIRETICNIDNDTQINDSNMYYDSLMLKIREYFELDNFEIQYHIIYNDILKQVNFVHNSLQSLACTFLDENEEIYFTTQNGYMLATLDTIENVVKVIDITSGRPRGLIPK